MDQSIVEGTEYSQIDINMAYLGFRNSPRESYCDVMRLMSRECSLSKKVRAIYRNENSNAENILEYMQVLVPYVAADTLERNPLYGCEQY